MSKENNSTKKLELLYQQACQSKDVISYWNKEEKKQEFIDITQGYTFPYNQDVEQFINDDKNIIKLAELYLLNILSKEKSEHKEQVNDIIVFARKLAVMNNFKQKLLAKAIWECLFFSTDLLSNEAAKLLFDTINQIVDPPKIVVPPKKDSENKSNKATSSDGKINKNSKNELQQFLNGLIYREILSFTKSSSTGKVLSLDENVKKIMKEIQCPVVSVLSRQGGVGKTTFVGLLPNWMFECSEKPPKVCIIDIDLSGPVWEHISFLSLNNKNDIPDDHKNLDDLIDLEQPLNAFKFPEDVNLEMLGPIIHESSFSGLNNQKISYVTFQDLPYTNRLLSLASELNQTSFLLFLASLLKQLSTFFDLVLIDNKPGFDGTSYCSMALAGSAPKGLPIVLSPPSKSSLYGVFMELNEIRVVELKTHPVWWLNKVGEDEDMQFYQQEKTWWDVAIEFKVYKENFPEIKLLKKVIHGKSLKFKWETFPFEADLARSNIFDQKKSLNEDNFSLVKCVNQYMNNNYAEWLKK